MNSVSRRATDFPDYHGRAMNEKMEPGAFDYEAALRACARGEKAALRQIYEREASRLIGVAYRIVHRREVANEVVHDAFIQIWQGSATFDAHRGSARGWIYSVVRHRALNTIRNSAREVPVDDDMLEAAADGAPGPLENLARLKDAKALHDCLSQLDAQKRDSILLAYVDGYSHSQIAARLNAPLGTVKAWIRRGLITLRECLA